jgi:hypothetical protein
MTCVGNARVQNDQESSISMLICDRSTGDSLLQSVSMCYVEPAVMLQGVANLCPMAT